MTLRVPSTKNVEYTPIARSEGLLLDEIATRFKHLVFLFYPEYGPSGVETAAVAGADDRIQKTDSNVAMEASLYFAS